MHIVFLLLLSLFVAHGDEGVGIDPNGGRLRSSGDSGSCIDPMGHPCVQALEGSAGNPLGAKVTGQGDGGPGMDPWG